MGEYKVFPGNPYPLGASVLSDNKINFALVSDSGESTGVILYDRKSKKTQKISFGEKNRIGNIYCACITDINPDTCEYTFFEGDREFCDPYGKMIVGNGRWGKTPTKLTSAFVRTEMPNDMSDDELPMLDYSDSIIYLMHVRGFTKHKSSNVTYPGTFSGIIQKIPYLKELGITTIELMPAYEFIELEENKAADKAPDTDIDVNDFYKPIEPKLNYWGYKKAYYFSPKSSYSEPGVSSVDSFMKLVRALHEAGMEIIMQFYFPEGIKQAYILEVLKYWVRTYHVDGFHLMGENMPLSLLGTEPMLANTKLMYYGFPVHEIYGNSKPKYRNLAVYNDDYMYSFRRFLKSDEGQVQKVIGHMRDIDERLGQVHYMTNCNGFTLMDLVSYDRKHNLENGENDRDGNPYNASWNCGYEGHTARRSINKLRRKQIKNAILLNMLTQSTPMLVAGDEFGNSQKGNNNPYCIDSPVTWLNWNDLDKNKDIYDFYKSAIELRQNNKILHMKSKFKLTDSNGCGYPDLSYHGDEAWKIQTDDLTRHFAMLYCDSDADCYIYVAINMHWTGHSFAIPKLPAGKSWYIAMDSGDGKENSKGLASDSKEILLKDRSIVVLMSK